MLATSSQKRLQIPKENEKKHVTDHSTLQSQTFFKKINKILYRKIYLEEPVYLKDYSAHKP